MPSYTVENTRLICKQAWETLIVEAWGKNGLRVRATRRAKVTGQDWALLPKDQLLDGGAPADSVRIHVDGEAARIACGDLECRISAEGWLSFWNGAGQLLFEEYWRNRNRIDRFALPLNIAARQLRPIPSADAFSLTMRFEAKEGEKFFGLGQYQDPYLDKKGSTLELAHRNCQSSVPFALSNRGYGFLWNNPAIGSVQLARNVTEWHAPSTLELD
jgi:alpha-D-xyloside xylohydrolase